ncbi:hypothetical protein KCP73_07800 [Salmonella enterica subsp. enterica]|nr:hypothetical protein KCP73_07800 [Salmonella enterica subsp. enterica]
MWSVSLFCWPYTGDVLAKTVLAAPLIGSHMMTIAPAPLGLASNLASYWSWWRLRYTSFRRTGIPQWFCLNELFSRRIFALRP